MDSAAEESRCRLLEKAVRSDPMPLSLRPLCGSESSFVNWLNALKTGLWWVRALWYIELGTAVNVLAC